MSPLNTSSYAYRLRLASRIGQLRALIVCVLLLILVTVLARFQPVPQPTAVGHKANMWNRFSRPLERSHRVIAPGGRAFIPCITVIKGSAGKFVFALGGSGILYTADGGQNWQARSVQPSQQINGIFFTDEYTGWTAGGDASGATILRTTDGGRSWQEQKIHIPNQTLGPLFSVAFANAQTGWAVGWNGVILNTTDGGQSWQKQSSGTTESLFSVALTDAQTGWAVGDGTMLHTSDGGQHWNPQEIGSKESNLSYLLYSVSFLDGQTGWAMDSERTLLHTADGGLHWQAQIVLGDYQPHAAAFVNQQTAWGVDDNGFVLHTVDGGVTWDEPSYQRLFAPWYYVAVLLLALSMLWFSLPLPELEEESIDAFARADKPIERLEEDSLGYSSQVRRLSRFIHNPKSEPPLVFSVQAPWGMGKSSVMRMLDAKLEDDNAAVTVWFNAWHHQNEDQMLAYLFGGDPVPGRTLMVQRYRHFLQANPVTHSAFLFTAALHHDVGDCVLVGPCQSRWSR
jgi:photosystem II stability/assembly factor-like uncharacterized protein